MISLNLLPKSKKIELGLAQLYVTIKNVIILILIITITVAISLLITKAALQNYFTKVVDQSTLTTQYASSFSQGVKKFNQKLLTVEKIQNDYIAWTKFLIKFAVLVPDDITVQSVEISALKISISGTAKTRASLLLLKENFEQSELFTKVEVPLDNLLKKENINFHLKANVTIKNL